ncbi:MAG: tol-pal system protein YbgF [Micropepsaceae bacterium]
MIISASKHAKRLFLVGTAAALLVLTPARTEDLDDVSDKVDRIERDLRELQFEIYKGNPPSESGGLMGGPVGGIGSGGARINDMEQSLRDLRGQVETLTFQVRQLTEQLDIARKESNYRLGALEGGAPATPIPGGANYANAPSPAPKPMGPAAAGGPASLTGSQLQGSKSGTLGSMPADALPQGMAGGLSPRQQYDAAMELLSRAQYTEAQGAFRGFVAANPADELAGPAQYWVGDIAFTQKDYQGAAKAFTDVLKRYSKTARAPDAMLKLGLSLLELNQKKEGCITLGAIKSKYPNANKAIFDRAAKRASEAKCT